MRRGSCLDTILHLSCKLHRQLYRKLYRILYDNCRPELAALPPKELASRLVGLVQAAVGNSSAISAALRQLQQATLAQYRDAMVGWACGWWCTVLSGSCCAVMCSVSKACHVVHLKVGVRARLGCTLFGHPLLCRGSCCMRTSSPAQTKILNLQGR